MTEFPNPDSWLDVVDHLWVGLVLIVAAGVPAWFANRNHRAIKAVERKADSITGQVLNSHPPEQNLRDDIDMLGADVTELKTDVTELKTVVGEIKAVLGQMVDQLIEWSPLIPMVRSFAPEIQGLRADLAEERESRRTLAADMRAEQARNRDEVTDLHKRLRDASAG